MLLLLLLPFGLFESKVRVSGSGQFVSVPPVVLLDPPVVSVTEYDPITLDAPWLFRQSVSGNTMLRVLLDGPVTDGYRKP